MSELHVVRARGKRKILKPITAEQLEKNLIEGQAGELIDSQHLLISMLLPPAVKAFFAELDQEVKLLCGARHSRGDVQASRWGAQPGSIVLGNQRVSISRPRVRGPQGEERLTTYEKFQSPALFDQTVFQEGLKRVSQRDYASGLPQIAASFGVSKSAVSRSWVNSTKKQVEKLLNRDLKPLGIVAVFIDGKRFSKLGVVVALGIAHDGQKHVLGIYQSSTENSAACMELLDDLQRRGLSEQDLLFIVDGGSGLNKALEVKYQVHDEASRRAARVRCFIHKWRNIEDVLTEKQASEAAPLFWAIREARDLTQALECADALEACLGKQNVSALASFREAKDDLLMLHQLGLTASLRKFFSTTNAIESLNSLLEEDLRRVKRWRDSEHFQRWLATACLRNEKRMRRIRGFQALPALKVKLQSLCQKREENVDSNGAVA
jgi:transposase-like protein